MEWSCPWWFDDKKNVPKSQKHEKDVKCTKKRYISENQEEDLKFPKKSSLIEMEENSYTESEKTEKSWFDAIYNILPPMDLLTPGTTPEDIIKSNKQDSIILNSTTKKDNKPKSRTSNLKCKPTTFANESADYPDSDNSEDIKLDHKENNKDNNQNVAKPVWNYFTDWMNDWLGGDNTSLIEYVDSPSKYSISKTDVHSVIKELHKKPIKQRITIYDETQFSDSTESDELDSIVPKKDTIPEVPKYDIIQNNSLVNNTKKVSYQKINTRDIKAKKDSLKLDFRITPASSYSGNVKPVRSVSLMGKSGTELHKKDRDKKQILSSRHKSESLSKNNKTIKVNENKEETNIKSSKRYNKQAELNNRSMNISDKANLTRNNIPKVATSCFTSSLKLTPEKRNLSKDSCVDTTKLNLVEFKNNKKHSDIKKYHHSDKLSHDLNNKFHNISKKNTNLRTSVDSKSNKTTSNSKKDTTNDLKSILSSRNTSSYQYSSIPSSKSLQSCKGSISLKNRNEVKDFSSSKTPLERKIFSSKNKDKNNSFNSSRNSCISSLNRNSSSISSSVRNKTVDLKSVNTCFEDIPLLTNYETKPVQYKSSSDNKSTTKIIKSPTTSANPHRNISAHNLDQKYLLLGLESKTRNKNSTSKKNIKNKSANIDKERLDQSIELNSNISKDIKEIRPSFADSSTLANALRSRSFNYEDYYKTAKTGAFSDFVDIGNIANTNCNQTSSDNTYMDITGVDLEIYSLHTKNQSTSVPHNNSSTIPNNYQRNVIPLSKYSDIYNKFVEDSYYTKPRLKCSIGQDNVIKYTYRENSSANSDSLNDSYSSLYKPLFYKSVSSYEKSEGDLKSKLNLDSEEFQNIFQDTDLDTNKKTLNEEPRRMNPKETLN